MLDKKIFRVKYNNEEFIYITIKFGDSGEYGLISTEQAYVNFSPPVATTANGVIYKPKTDIPIGIISKDVEIIEQLETLPMPTPEALGKALNEFKQVISDILSAEEWHQKCNDTKNIDRFLKNLPAAKIKTC